jgi:hypothetical protein
MNVFGFFKQRPDLRTVIDVGSHTTKAVIFEMPPRDSHGSRRLPKIVKKMVLKLPLLYKEDRVIAKLREFIFAVVRELERVPEKITVAFSSTLIGASLVELRTPLSHEGGGVLSKDGVRAYFNVAVKEHTEIPTGSIIIPVDFSINGYPAWWSEPSCQIFSPRPAEYEGVGVSAVSEITRPYTPHGRIRTEGEISFHSFVLKPSKDVELALTHMKQSLGGMSIEFIPLVIAQKEAMVYACGVKDALLVDMGGEETVVLLMREYTVRSTVSFPIGVRHFLRGVSKMTSLTFEEAEDLKRQDAQGLISSSQREKLHQFLAQEIDRWKQQYREALESLYHYGPIPSTIFLCGGGAHLPEMRSLLQSEDLFEGLSHAVKPSVIVFEATRLFEGSSLGGFLQGPEELGLASLMAYSLCHEPIF